MAPPPDNEAQHPSTAARHARVGTVLVLGSALAFSTKAIFVKLAYVAGAGIDAVTILTARMAFGLPFFIAAAVWSARRARRAGRPGTWRDRLGAAGLGLLGFYLASLLDTAGLEYISAATERVVLFVYPTLVVILGAVFLKERPGPRLLSALAATYAGLAVAVAADRAGGDAALARGAVLVFGAAAAFAVYSVAALGFVRRMGTLGFSAWAMSAATAATALHFAVLHGPTLAGLTPRALLLCLAMALVATAVPAVLMTEGLRRVGPGRAAILGTIGPVATLGLDHAVLGTPVTAAQTVGTLLVLAGVVAAGRARGG